MKLLSLHMYGINSNMVDYQLLLYYPKYQKSFRAEKLAMFEHCHLCSDMLPRQLPPTETNHSPCH